MKRYLITICSCVMSLLLGSGVTSLLFISHYKTEENKDINNTVLASKNNSIEIAKFSNPLPEEWMNRISSTQGLRNKIKSNNGGMVTENCYHNAIDIAVPEGTSVFATKVGKVVTVYPSYYNGGAKYHGHPVYGGLVEIQHDDGTKTMYAHLSYTIVREGDIVECGQKIGESGGVVGKRGSGKTTGPHLHYSIIMDLNTFSS